MINRIAFLIVFCLLSSAQAEPAKNSGGSSGAGWKVPVRFNVFAGYQSGSNSFDADKKDYLMNTFVLGGDFNVPVPPLHGLIGLTGWLIPAVTTGSRTSSTSVVLGPYLGYLRDADDFYLGGGVASMYTNISDTDAAPNNGMNLTGNLACGFAGWRHYFGKGFTGGIGLTAYSCAAGSYEKKLNSTTGPTTTSTVSEKASSSGGFLYLMISWNAERKII